MKIRRKQREEGGTAVGIVEAAPFGPVFDHVCEGTGTLIQVLRIMRARGENRREEERDHVSGDQTGIVHGEVVGENNVALHLAENNVRR